MWSTEEVSSSDREGYLVPEVGAPDLRSVPGQEEVLRYSGASRCLPSTKVPSSPYFSGSASEENASYKRCDSFTLSHHSKRSIPLFVPRFPSDPSHHSCSISSSSGQNTCFSSVDAVLDAGSDVVASFLPAPRMARLLDVLSVSLH